MIAYLLKSGLCLALLLAFYHLVLEREKMHQFNRFYLLGSVLFSFIVPSIIIYVEAKNSTVAPIGFTEKLVVENQSFFNQYFTLQNILLTLYTLVSLLFLIRFTRNLYCIIQKIRINEVIKSEYAKFVPVSDTISPHTFWNYIFINKEDYSNKKIEEEVFTHELAHVTQKHTIDVLILETLQILFWFNPLFFLLKKAVQLNHEFLADDQVIASHKNISRYQTLLLSKASWKNEYYLASNLNYSLTKKRLLMMKTQNSKKAIFLKKIAIVPLLAGLVFAFANRVEAQTKKEKSKPVKIEVVEKGATEAQMKEYKDFTKGVNKNSTFKLNDVKRLGYLYSIMSDEQKKSVKNINDFLPPPPPPAKIIAKEIKKKLHPRPIKIEVIEEKEKLPRPAKKSKKYKVVEVKSDKKEALELVENEEVVHEIEVEKVEVLEEAVEKEVEHIEETETPHEKVVEVIELLHEGDPKEHYKLDLEELKKKGAQFYLNGKSISYRKAKKLFENSNEIQSVEVLQNGKTKVMFTSR